MLEVIRYHQLLEAYLSEHLDYSWTEVHDEADRLEHHVSDECVARVASALDKPKVEPQGEPIPNDLLEFPFNTLERPLSEFEAETVFVVERLSDRDPNVPASLSEPGIDSGIEFVIGEDESFGLNTLEPAGDGESDSLTEHAAQFVLVASPSRCRHVF